MILKMIWFWINNELKKHTNKLILLVLFYILFCVDNDFESTTSWKSILHLNTYSIPILCILCRKWFWKWYFQLTITWGTILHLSTQTIPLVCILFEKWFWISDQLRNHVTFEHQINSQYLSISIVLVHIWSFTLFLIPDICHESHENTRVNFFWLV